MLKNIVPLDMVVTSTQPISPLVQPPNSVVSNVNYQIQPPTVQYSVPYSLAAFNYVSGLPHPQFVSPPLSQVVQLVATPNPNFQYGNTNPQGLLSGPPPQFYPVTTLPMGVAQPTLSLPLQPHFQIPLAGNRPPIQTPQPNIIPNVLAGGQQQTQHNQVRHRDIKLGMCIYLIDAFFSLNIFLTNCT